jgi:hypothetical protein
MGFYTVGQFSLFAVLCSSVYLADQEKMALD